MFIERGEVVPVTGYFTYKDRPEYDTIPCYLKGENKVKVLEKGVNCPTYIMSA